MSISRLLKKIKSWFSPKKRQQGTIKFFDRKKRFGFIVSGKNEYFFHAAATQPNDFKSLQDGVKVTFNVVIGKKGPQADHVEVVHD